MLWPRQREHADRYAQSDEEWRDIIEVEAVGPLVLLSSWLHLFVNALWIHFIDNNSALGGLVKGSASVGQQDIIIGHTWTWIARLNVSAWFDRVDSASNPVDGISRKDFSGFHCWERVQIPPEVLQDLRRAARKM